MHCLEKPVIKDSLQDKQLDSRLKNLLLRIGSAGPVHVHIGHGKVVQASPGLEKYDALLIINQLIMIWQDWKSLIPSFIGLAETTLYMSERYTNDFYRLEGMYVMYNVY